MDRRGKLLGVLATALILSLSSGCLALVDNAAAQAPEETTATASPAKDSKGHLGDLSGSVQDQLGTPIEGAHIALLGTDRFATTGADGTFSISDIPEGTYVLRVDAAGFSSFETSVTIQKKQTTRVAITLVAPGCVPHYHDRWGGSTQAVLVNQTVDLNGDGEIVMTAETGVLDPNPGGPNREFAIPAGRIVFPGTERMDILFTWANDATNTIESIGAAYQSPDAADAIRLPPHASGDGWSFNVTEAMGDSGHAKTTAWRFYFYVPAHETPTLGLGSLHVKIVIHKGDLPLEGCDGHQAS